MSAPAGTGVASGVGWYVYGVVDADAEPPAGHVETLRQGSLAALVSHVDLDEFGEEPVRERLEDPAWLEEKVRAHETVLDAALASGAVVPFRFLTVYRDESELRSFLETRGDQLRSVLDRIRGMVELGVKAFVDRAALERELGGRSAAVAELDAEIADAPVGRAYLLQRKRDEAARDEATRQLAEIARDSHARLIAAADDGVANPVQKRELSGRSEDMLLNGAYLVPATDNHLEPELRALAELYEPLGITFEQTGPWPPYNFVPRDLGADDAA